MGRDILVTTPLKRSDVAAEEGYYGIEYGKETIYFKTFSKKPKNLEVGSRIFYVEDGFIRGFATVAKIKQGTMECGTSGKEYTGFHAVMYADSWKWIKPVPHKGFEGYRYFDATGVEVVGNYKDRKPIVDEVLNRLNKKVSKVVINLKPTKQQIDSIIEDNDSRIIFALSNRNAEDLAEYLNEKGITSRYFHFEIDPQERRKILSEFKRGEFQRLVAVSPTANLPRVSSVAVLDADHPRRDAESLLRMTAHASCRISFFADKKTSLTIGMTS